MFNYVDLSGPYVLLSDLLLIYFKTLTNKRTIDRIVAKTYEEKINLFSELITIFEIFKQGKYSLFPQTALISTTLTHFKYQILHG